MFPIDCFAGINGVGSKSKCRLWGFSTTTQPSEDPSMGKVMLTYPVAIVQDVLTGKFSAVFLNNLEVLPEINLDSARAEVNGFSAVPDLQKELDLRNKILDKGVFDFIQATRIIELCAAMCEINQKTLEQNLNALLK